MNDVYCGVPARIGEDGIEETLEIALSAEESEALKRSAAQVKEGIEYLRKSRMI
ncbi:MAG: hypothetical protein WC512_01810 [Candidatus Omnitrophota bacterium]